MTKAQLIEQITKDGGISKAKAGRALDSFIDSVTEALKKKDGKVILVGFGTFSKAHRKARQGVNPATGEKITIYVRDVIKFQASKALKEAVS